MLFGNKASQSQEVEEIKKEKKKKKKLSEWSDLEIIVPKEGRKVGKEKEGRRTMSFFAVPEQTNKAPKKKGLAHSLMVNLN